MIAYGGVEIYLHAFLTSALDGSEWLASGSGRFIEICCLVRGKPTVHADINMKQSDINSRCWQHTDSQWLGHHFYLPHSKDLRFDDRNMTDLGFRFSLRRVWRWLSCGTLRRVAIVLIKEAGSISETSVNFYQTTRRNISEDSHLRNITDFAYVSSFTK
jgi:hypothetical protein